MENDQKLWTSNFVLLWMGKLISSLGDVVYGMALGFWVLEVTGSTVLMGTMMGVTTLPRILMLPFAGVFVDRMDRKGIIVWMDLLRGGVIILMAVAIHYGSIHIGIMFLVGVFLGVCGAFFTPAINSVLPDIVSPSKLMTANSLFGMVQTGSGIIGNAVGGFIVGAFGAPFVFLTNGLSYLLSGFSENFLDIPRINQKGKNDHFMNDMKEGYRFVWRFNGLRNLLIVVSVLNFILSVAVVLFLPLYQKTESLGPGKYGISMAFLTGGMFLGLLFTSVIKIAPLKKMIVFMVCAILSSLSFILFALIKNFPVMLALILIGGALISIVNILIHSTIQLIVPPDMRGKIFALLSMSAQGLMPVGMILSGFLAKFISIRLIIGSCFFAELLVFILFGFNVSFKELINFDPEKETFDNVTGQGAHILHRGG